MDTSSASHPKTEGKRKIANISNCMNRMSLGEAGKHQAVKMWELSANRIPAPSKHKSRDLNVYEGSESMNTSSASHPKTEGKRKIANISNCTNRMSLGEAGKHQRLVKARSRVLADMKQAKIKSTWKDVDSSENLDGPMRKFTRRRSSLARSRIPISDEQKRLTRRKPRLETQPLENLPSDVMSVVVNGINVSGNTFDTLQQYKNKEARLDFPLEFGSLCPGKGKSRIILVDWLIQVQEHLKMDQLSLYLAVQIIDRFLMANRIKLDEFQLLGITSLLIAAKYEERFPPKIKMLLHLTADSYKYSEVIRMEQVILNSLSCDLSIPTPLRFLEEGFEIIGKNAEVKNLSSYLLDLALPHVHMLQCLPSVQAAAALYVAHEIVDNLEAVSSDTCFRSLLYYMDCQREDFLDCIVFLIDLVRKASKASIQATRKKYSTRALGFDQSEDLRKNKNFRELLNTILSSVMTDS